MVPKFSNPHLLRQATQAVTRADINAERDLGQSGDVPIDDVLALDNILKRTLGGFQPEQRSSSNTDEPKRKRRKGAEPDNAQVAKPEESVSFRLFSNAPAKVISLKPKPPPKIKVTERVYEDDDAEASLRAERAKAAAVDIDWILQQSRQPTYPTHSDKNVIHVRLGTTSTEPSAPVMVAEIPRATPSECASQLPLSLLRLPEKEHPSPHDFPSDKVCCPVIYVLKTSEGDLRDKKKRRRKIARDGAVPKQPPSFFRPLKEWGGKSAGYAMGYEGSRPVPTGSVRQWKYRRDSMRSGVMSRWTEFGR